MPEEPACCSHLSWARGAQVLMAGTGSTGPGQQGAPRPRGFLPELVPTSLCRGRVGKGEVGGGRREVGRQGRGLRSGFLGGFRPQCRALLRAAALLAVRELSPRARGGTLTGPETRVAFFGPLAGWVIPASCHLPLGGWAQFGEIT